MIKLISVNNDRLKQEVLDIYIGNDYYFNKILNIPQKITNVEQDITNIPDGVQKSQKNYRLVSFNDEILGVVDYITGYPERNTVFIGLFIIKNNKHRQGFGRKIFNYIENLFKSEGFLKIRLGVITDNEIGFSFWKKQNFKEIERKVLKFGNSEKEVIVMEKKI